MRLQYQLAYATEIKSIQLRDSIEGLSQKIVSSTLHYTIHYITHITFYFNFFKKSVADMQNARYSITLSSELLVETVHVETIGFQSQHSWHLGFWNYLRLLVTGEHLANISPTFVFM